MPYFYDKILELNECKDIISALLRGNSPVAVTGAIPAAKAHITASVIKKTGKKCIYICSDEAEAMRAVSIFEAVLEEKVYFYPARDYNLYRANASTHDYSSQRLAALTAISSGCPVVVTVPEAVAQYTIPKDELLQKSMKLTKGNEAELSAVCDFLTICGYERCDMVEGEGQFALRGGILDFFAPNYENPVRVEFFGDEPDIISFFDAGTQRRTNEISEVFITPAIETIISEQGKSRIITFLNSLISELSRKRNETAKAIKELLQEDLQKLSEGLDISLDVYIGILYSKKETILNYIENTDLTVFSETVNCDERLKGYLWHLQEDIKQLMLAGKLSGLTELCLTREQYQAELGKKSVVFADILPHSRYLLPAKALVSVKTRQTAAFSSMELMTAELKESLQNGYTTVFYAKTDKRAIALCKSFEEYGVSSVCSQPQKNVNSVFVLVGNAPIHVQYQDIKLSIFSEGVQQAVPIRKKTKSKTAGEKIKSYKDLSIGDYVVHIHYGIGIYAGIKKITALGVTKDYIKINFAGKDTLFVPCNQLDLISKYISASENVKVKLSKMGGTEWYKTKQRVKAAVSDMAEQLTKLYAERNNINGFEFPPDDIWQREFEDFFEYEETEDQLRCTSEIKQDMQISKPMDRLLCGDVGFGKTEVALRAVFKCISAGKQAAILVPTTILAFQHYQTILKRMINFPVKVEMLSRFRTKKQQEESLVKIRKGESDLVIGTHRLLQKDVKFKDLGLVIIDEEQRFGVSHKEKLKEMFKSTDALTLSATPIPRTLNMALSGIRDMSVIEEPPHDRSPVQTYVLEYDIGIIAEAIKRELRRAGQVFYLYNRVETIDKVAVKLMEAVPEASVAVAHGQMNEEALSKVWESVISGETNVLVCTTIIETGVDIPNANTLIIEDADRLGLSQLHQIRGRVGRSNKRAYAYFTYRKGKILTEDAVKRLSTIREFTEFGSGLKIALRDLEIRGAGNVLGAEQSGHMEAVGYDLYLKLLEEAVSTVKGEIPKKVAECSVDLFIDSHIPQSYIENEKIRIDIYKKIAAIENNEDIEDLTDELIDRFSEPPREVINLCQISLIRNMASILGITDITQKEQQLIFAVPDMTFERVAKAISIYKGRMFYQAGKKPCISVKAEGDVLFTANNVLEALEKALEGSKNK